MNLTWAAISSFKLRSLLVNDGGNDYAIRIFQLDYVNEFVTNYLFGIS
jgi:hypothetical protein